MGNNIAFLITTYNRPYSIQRLFDSVKDLGDVYIVNDGGVNISLPCKIQKKKHGGKPGYYGTVSLLWQMVRGLEYDYYIMIPDDFIPVDGFIDKAIKIWNEIPGKNKITLNFYTDVLRYKKNCWTMVEIAEYENYLYTGWVDMCFLATYDFFKMVNYTCRKPNRDFSNKQLGSGVGSYLSHYFIGQGRGMYQVKKSLFIPQEEAYISQMNPQRPDNENINEIMI